MSEFKKIQWRNSTRYMMRGYNQRFRLVAQADIPDSAQKELEKMGYGVVYNTDPTYVAPPPAKVVEAKRECLFCGQPAKSPRFVNLQMVFLCNEHNQTMTVGKIAQKLKEVQYA